MKSLSLYEVICVFDLVLKDERKSAKAQSRYILMRFQSMDSESTNYVDGCSNHKVKEFFCNIKDMTKFLRKNILKIDPIVDLSLRLNLRIG